jgi:hypothetical protein
LLKPRTLAIIGDDLNTVLVDTVLRLPLRQAQARRETL